MAARKAATLAPAGAGSDTDTEPDSDDAPPYDEAAAEELKKKKQQFEARSYFRAHGRRRDTQRLEFERAARGAAAEAADVLVSHATAAALRAREDRPQWRSLPAGVDGEAMLQIAKQAARALGIAAQVAERDRREFIQLLAARSDALAALGRASGGVDYDSSTDSSATGGGGGSRGATVATWSGDVHAQRVLGDIAPRCEALARRLDPAKPSTADTDHGHSHSHGHGHSHGSHHSHHSPASAAADAGGDDDDAESSVAAGGPPPEALAGAAWRLAIANACRAVRMQALLAVGDACLVAGQRHRQTGALCTAADAFKAALLTDQSQYRAWLARGDVYGALGVPMLASLHYARAGRVANKLRDGLSADADARQERAESVVRWIAAMSAVDRLRIEAATLADESGGTSSSGPATRGAAAEAPAPSSAEPRVVSASMVLSAAHRAKSEGNLIFREGYFESSAIKYAFALQCVAAVAAAADLSAPEANDDGAGAGAGAGADASSSPAREATAAAGAGAAAPASASSRTRGARRGAFVSSASDFTLADAGVTVDPESAAALTTAELASVDFLAVSCHINLASCLLKQQTDYAAAAQHATAALLVDPSSGKARFKRACALERMGRYLEALEDFAGARRLLLAAGKGSAALRVTRAAEHAAFVARQIGDEQQRAAVLAFAAKHGAAVPASATPATELAPGDGEVHRKPDIVLVIAMGAPDASFASSSAGWQWLQRNGTVFTQHRASSAAHEPALASLLTGTPARAHGVSQSAGVCKYDEDTLMSWLRRGSDGPGFARGATVGHALKLHGYHTAFAGPWRLSPAGRGGGAASSPGGAAGSNALECHGFDQWIRPAGGNDSFAADAGATATAAAEWLAAQAAATSTTEGDRAAPLLLVVALGDARRWHEPAPFRFPCRPPAASATTTRPAVHTALHSSWMRAYFPSDALGSAAGTAGAAASAEREFPAREWSEECARRCTALGDAVTTVVTAARARADASMVPVHTLATATVLDSTGAHGLPLPNHCAYDAAVRVPLAAATLPGFRAAGAATSGEQAALSAAAPAGFEAGHTCDTLTSATDIAVTLARLARGADGVDHSADLLHAAQATATAPVLSASEAEATFFETTDCPFVGSGAVVAAARVPGVASYMRRLHLHSMAMPRDIVSAAVTTPAGVQAVVHRIRCVGMAQARVFKLVRYYRLVPREDDGGDWATGVGYEMFSSVPGGDGEDAGAAGAAAAVSRDDEWELFDLSRDPEERTNLAVARPTHPLTRRVAWRLLAELVRQQLSAAATGDAHTHSEKDGLRADGGEGAVQDSDLLDDGSNGSPLVSPALQLALTRLVPGAHGYGDEDGAYLFAELRTALACVLAVIALVVAVVLKMVI